MNQLVALLLGNLGLGLTFVILVGLVVFGGLWLIEGFSGLRPVPVLFGAVLLIVGALGMLEFPFEQWQASKFW
jgi:hypothetical protein